MAATSWEPFSGPCPSGSPIPIRLPRRLISYHPPSRDRPRSGSTSSRKDAVSRPPRRSCPRSGRDRLAALATFGPLAAEGVTRIAENAPTHGTDLVSSIGRPTPFPIVERFELEMPPEQSRAAAGHPDDTEGPAEFVGRIRFADGMPAGPIAFPLLVDAFPPTAFRLGLFGWTPTLELTVHTRGEPAPGPLTLRVRSRYLINGLMEEDGELWDGTGALVAISRQLAKVIV